MTQTQRPQTKPYLTAKLGPILAFVLALSAVPSVAADGPGDYPPCIATFGTRTFEAPDSRANYVQYVDQDGMQGLIEWMESTKEWLFEGTCSGPFNPSSIISCTLRQVFYPLGEPVHLFDCTRID